ncbi:MAG: NAD(P)/FAD-dependent oxidoreductase [Acidobacteria bacterium]|nr:NAD(P)/FAD-dependent oxidoreductase [Acidobacteriota bacterium]
MRPRVVIIGAGFGGISAAKALKDADVDITLVDRTNHHLFQPLLYQVATGLLSPSDIAIATRFLLRRQANVRVRMAEVTAIDLDRKLVIEDGGLAENPYDYLVVSTGARHSYFGNPDWEQLAPGLKTLDDARELRHRFLLALEEAEKTSDAALQRALLTIVVVGGGPTGVELAGILPTIVHRGIRADYRSIDAAAVRVVLLEGGTRLLPAFPEALSARAARDLEVLGVEVRTNALVTRITPEAVFIEEERIDSRTVFWAAGNAASPLVKAMGVEMDRAGRALVSGDLSVPGRPEVFVIGDAAAVPLDPGEAPVDAQAEKPPRLVPGLAAAANQMGEHAAATIRRTLEGQPRRPFLYRDRGSMAIIGRNKAVADFGRFTLKGRAAFFTWVFVHLLYLVGFRNRLSVAIEWGYAYFTHRPGARLVTDSEIAREAPRALRAGGDGWTGHE